MDQSHCLASTDDELAAAIADGDRNAFAELYDRFAPQVLGRLSKQLADATEAESMMLDVFADLWQQAPRLDRSPGSIANWLFGTAHPRRPAAGAAA